MKKIKKSFLTFIVIFFVTVGMGTQTAFSDISNCELEQKIKRLEEQINKTSGAGEGSSFVQAIVDRVSISGAVEVELGFENGYDDEDSSDITLATAELGIDAEIIDWVNGHILFCWDDDADEFEVDEATITLGNLEIYPVYFTAGKMYVPFGSYETNMISDPLTLELGETRESALQVGFEMSGFYGSVYAFNGDIDEDREDDQIGCFGANAGYAYEIDDISIDIGLGWINNLVDSNGWGDTVEEEMEAAEEIGIAFSLKDYVSGFAAYAIFNYGPFTLIGEYVGATEDSEWNIDAEPATMTAYGLDPTETVEAPSAWNMEAGYTFEIISRETTFGVAYQGTNNCGEFLPETRIVAAIGVGLTDYLGVALEYAHDEDYDEVDGGTGDDADVVTIQLALEF